jgi:hypothetical protein
VLFFSVVAVFTPAAAFRAANPPAVFFAIVLS